MGERHKDLDIIQNIPLNSRWKHTNGNIYVVYDHTNVCCDRADYPLRISYRNEETGQKYSKDAEGWFNNRTIIQEEETLVDRFRKIFGNISKEMDVRVITRDKNKDCLLVSFVTESNENERITEEINSFKRYVEPSNFTILSINFSEQEGLSGVVDTIVSAVVKEIS
jgi:hypothetical protein